MFNWLHHLIEPHCSQCELDKHYVTEKLSLMLEQERAEKFRLLTLLAPSREVSINNEAGFDISGLRRNPKSVLRDLERNSQVEAENIRKRAEHERISQIEKELGVEN